MQALLQYARCALSVLTTIAFGVSIDERAGAIALLAVDAAAPPRHPLPLWGRSWAEDVAAFLARSSMAHEDRRPSEASNRAAYAANTASHPRLTRRGKAGQGPLTSRTKETNHDQSDHLLEQTAPTE